MKKLLKYICANDIDDIRHLLNQSNLVNERLGYNWTPLMVAAEYGYGHTETVSLLLEMGADIHAKNDDGSTALILAAQKGRSKNVSLLLQRGADIHDKDNHGRNALIFSALFGHTETVALLLDSGADIHAKDRWGENALMYAAQNGHTETVVELLAHGSDINAVAKDGSTALMFAARKGHNETISLLLDRDADIHAKKNNGWTALMIAALNGHTDTASLLLNADADINETISLLLNADADIHDDKSDIIRTMAKASWWTDNHNAVISNNLDQIQSLEDQSSPITPIDLAIMIGNLDAVKHIIERASISTSSHTLFNSTHGIKFDLNDCLNKAIKAKRNDIAMFFLENGADPRFKNQLGQNSLHIAYTYGNENIIKPLLERIHAVHSAISIQRWFRSYLFENNKANCPKEYNATTCLGTPTPK